MLFTGRINPILVCAFQFLNVDIFFIFLTEEEMSTVKGKRESVEVKD